MKRADSNVIPHFLVTAHKIKVTGEKQVETEIKNLMKFKPFLKILCSRKERRELIGYCGFSCLFGTGSKFLTVAKMH